MDLFEPQSPPFIQHLGALSSTPLGFVSCFSSLYYICHVSPSLLPFARLVWNYDMYLWRFQLLLSFP